MGTDLTYADLGLVDLSARSFRLVITEDLDGRSAHKIEMVPADASVYSRVVTWVDAESSLPLRRDYYDVGGELWRRATYEAAAGPGAERTIKSVTVEDLQDKFSTELTYDSSRYDVVTRCSTPRAWPRSRKKRTREPLLAE